MLIITRAPRPKKRKLLGLFGLLSLMLLVWWGMEIGQQQYGPVDPADTTYHEVVIPAGSTAKEIAAILKEKELIFNENTFLRFCKKEKIDNRLRPGRYQFKRSQSLEDIAFALARGDIMMIRLTIPEGYSMDQIARLVEEKEICTREEWEEAVNAEYDLPFLHHIPAQEKPLEGFLYPDTYIITDDTNAPQLVKMILENFQKQWDTLFAAQAQKKGMDIYDCIIIASLIEKEARVPGERETISGVIRNRLEIGQKLQIDASVLYSLGEHREVVYYSDLEVDSPYNTYKYGGLPPGPIASPGAASISAALNPENHSYYYYVARGDGSHHFSRTYAEHLRAIKKHMN